MEWIKQNIFSKMRRKHAIFGIGMMIPVILLIPQTAAAAVSITNLILQAINLVVSFLVGKLYIPLMGDLMLWLMKNVVAVAHYNSFGDSTAVTIGWILLRDMTNMLLVILMLMMAFGTLLNRGDLLGDYKSLPKFVIIAVVINFSKMITLMVIDVGQVVMLSFVSAFRNTAGGNFLQAFGIKDWFTIGDFGDAGNDKILMGVLISYIFAAILVTVVVVVMMVFLSYLVIRIAMLWILIIFSPLAFALNLMPTRGKKQYGQWWEYLISTIVTGPLLAFFLWLTLIVAGTSGGGVGKEVLADAQAIRAAQEKEAKFGTETIQTERQKKFGNEMLDSDSMMTFFISIVMLLLGLKITSEMGGVVGGAAVGVTKKGTRFVGKLAKGGAKRVGKGVANMEITRGGDSLAGYTKAGVEKVRKSGVGKAVGLDSDYTSLKHAEREARARRTLGDETGARRLEQGVISKNREGFKDLTNDQVADTMKNSAKGSLQYKAAALHLAKNKYFNDKKSDIAGIGGGDKDFQKQFVAEANAGGANYVNVPSGKTKQQAVEDKIATSTKGELNKFYGTIDLDIRKARNGKGEMVDADPVGEAKLLAMDKETFKDLSPQNKKKFEKAALLGMKNKTGASRTKLADKLKEVKGYESIDFDAATGYFTGAKVAATYHKDGRPKKGAYTMGASEINGVRSIQEASLIAQQKNNTDVATKGRRKKDGTVSSVDTGLSQSFDKLSSGNKALLETSSSSLETALDGMLAGSAPARFTAARSVLSTAAGGMDAAFKSNDVAGKATNRKNAAGGDMKHEDLFNDSSLKGAMDQLDEALSTRQTLETSGSATAPARRREVDQLIGSLRKEILEHVKSVKSKQSGPGGAAAKVMRGDRASHREKLGAVSSRLKTSMSSVKSVETPKAQRKHMAEAGTLMKAGSKSMGRSAVSKAQKDAVAALKRDISAMNGRIKGEVFGSKTADQAAIISDLEALQTRYNDLKDQLS